MSDDAFRDEQRCLVHVWTFLGVTSDVARDGDWFRASIAGRSIFVQRFASELRGFENRCAHRFYPLRNADRGNGPLICGFHGWQYDRNGRAVGVPQCREVFGVIPQDLGGRLVRLEVATCGMLIFGRFPAPAPAESLQTFLGEGFDILSAVCTPKGWLLPISDVVQANWKLCVHASLDDYHLVNVHPSTFGKHGPLRLGNISYHRFAAHLAYINTEKQRPFETLHETCRGGTFEPADFTILHFAPSTLVLLFPTVLSIWYCGIVHYEPLARDQTRMRGWFFPVRPTGPTTAWQGWLRKMQAIVFAPFIRHYARRILGEDHRVCERLQNNAARICSFPTLSALESRIWWFEETCRRLIAQGRKLLLVGSTQKHGASIRTEDIVLSAPSELLSFMLAQPGVRRCADGLHIGKSMVTGIALYGPYRRFRAGWHRIAIALSWRELDSDAVAGLKIEVAVNEGQQILAVNDLPAAKLRGFGQNCVVEVRFYLPPQLSGHLVEIRLWRNAPCAVDVARISLLSTYPVG